MFLRACSRHFLSKQSAMDAFHSVVVLKILRPHRECRTSSKWQLHRGRKTTPEKKLAYR